MKLHQNHYMLQQFLVLQEAQLQYYLLMPGLQTSPVPVIPVQLTLLAFGGEYATEIWP